MPHFFILPPQKILTVGYTVSKQVSLRKCARQDFKGGAAVSNVKCTMSRHSSLFQMAPGYLFSQSSASDSEIAFNHLTALKLASSLKKIYVLRNYPKQCAKGVPLCRGHGLKRMVNSHGHLLET